ncbi:hypothetical protein K1719_029166 [Acacia pycnantha]|nr:hypothetical protein K1719_029166 [Acacia pycnantha]
MASTFQNGLSNQRQKQGLSFTEYCKGCGIGLEVARNLAFSGAHLVMAARNTKAAHDLINQWNYERSYSSDDDEAKQLLDIESFSEEDGFETHLQVNHLAPTLLTILLLPSLKKGSPSRIVNNSSTSHFLTSIDVDDMNFTSSRRRFSRFQVP